MHFRTWKKNHIFLWQSWQLCHRKAHNLFIVMCLTTNNYLSTTSPFQTLNAFHLFNDAIINLLHALHVLHPFTGTLNCKINQFFPKDYTPSVLCERRFKTVCKWIFCIHVVTPMFAWQCSSIDDTLWQQEWSHFVISHYIANFWIFDGLRSI